MVLQRYEVLGVWKQQPPQHLRLALQLSQLSFRHQVLCGGPWAFKTSLVIGRSTLPGWCAAAEIYFAFAERSLYRSHCCGTFLCCFSLRCCKVRGSAGTGGPATPVLQPRLPRHQVNLESPSVIKFMWRPLGIFSKGGERLPPIIRLSRSLLFVVVTQTLVPHLLPCKCGLES